MSEREVPYGKKPIGRMKPGPGETDAQALESARAGPTAGRGHTTYHGVPPVKSAPFDLPHIPLYFWVGGIAAGSWLAATAESWAGGDDRDVVRAGRYLTLGSVLAGTGLLVADLGRPERFLNMLRIIRLRSPMSLGSWALASFGAYAGIGALLQAAEDGLLGHRPRLARLSTGSLGKALHLLGAPAAMFVGSYTGVLLASTASPSLATRSRVLPALFTASASASGLAAVAAALEATGGARPGTAQRLARGQTVALGAELALELLDAREARRLPSGQRESTRKRAVRWAALGLGVAVPLVLNALEGFVRDDDAAHDVRRLPFPDRRRSRPRAAGRGRAARRLSGRHLPGRRVSGRRVAAAALSLAGSLAMRWLTVDEGQRSAETPEDTWVYAGNGRRVGLEGHRAR